MEFKKLSEVQLVEGAVDTANVLIEENGEIKRIPKTEVGGAAFPTLIIEDEMYENCMRSLLSDSGDPVAEPAEADAASPYSFTGLTFEEAYERLLNGEIINVIYKGLFSEYPSIMPGRVCFAGNSFGSIECIMLVFLCPTYYSQDIEIFKLYWTADGILENPPGGEE